MLSATIKSEAFGTDAFEVKGGRRVYMTKKEKELLADRAAARYYVGNLLVYAKALNTELCQLGFHSESANDYGMQINDNLNRLAKKLNVRIADENIEN